jgi:hypothetical protein
MLLISQHLVFSRILLSTCRHGRPTLYSDALLDEIVKNCRKGQGSGTNKEIAAFCRVNESTVYRWKKEHPELEAAIEQAVSGNCDLVEGTLLHLAVSGDMAAIQFYLKNHRPDKWREKKHIDMHASGAIQMEYPVLDVDKMVHLSPEQKAEFSRTCRAYQEAINALALMSASVSDGESDKD